MNTNRKAKPTGQGNVPVQNQPPGEVQRKRDDSAKQTVTPASRPPDGEFRQGAATSENVSRRKGKAG